VSGYLAVESALNSAPGDWKRLTFKRLTVLVKEPNVQADEPLLSLASSGVVSARVEMDGLGRQAPNESTIRDYWKLRPEQVVVNPMWLVGGSIGVSAVAGAVSPAYRVYRVRPGVLPRFLHYSLRAYPYMEQYRLLGRGDTTFDRSVGREDFEGLPVLLPPIGEQRRISDFLDDQVARLDRAIELRLRQAERLTERLRGMVIALVSGQDRSPLIPTRSRWFPLLPVGWRVVRLKHEWRVIDCKHRTPVYLDEGYRVVSTAEVKPGRLDLSLATRFVAREDFLDLADDLRRPRRGDLVYSRNASIGTAAYVDTDDSFTMGQDVCRITSHRANQLFLSFVLNYAVHPQLDYEKVGATFSRINVERILALSIPVPPRELQDGIANNVDLLIAAHGSAERLGRRQNKLLAERKKSLITAAVTGQLDVTTARSVA